MTNKDLRNSNLYATLRDITSVLSVEALTVLFFPGQPAEARMALTDELCSRQNAVYASVRRSLSDVATDVLPTFVGKTLSPVHELAVWDELAARRSSM